MVDDRNAPIVHGLDFRLDSLARASSSNHVRASDITAREAEAGARDRDETKDISILDCKRAIDAAFL